MDETFKEAHALVVLVAVYEISFLNQKVVLCSSIEQLFHSAVGNFLKISLVS